jgi:hypothetical protein
LPIPPIDLSRWMYSANEVPIRLGGFRVGEDWGGIP